MSVVERSRVVRLSYDLSSCQGTETFTGTVSGVGSGTLVERDVSEVAPRGTRSSRLHVVGTFQSRYTSSMERARSRPCADPAQPRATFDLEGNVAGTYSGQFVVGP